MKNRKAYQKAKRIAKARFRLGVDIPAFIVVSILLVTLNLLTSPEYLWVQWPLLLWSLVVFWYAIVLIIFKGKYGLTQKMWH